MKNFFQSIKTQPPKHMLASEIPQENPKRLDETEYNSSNNNKTKNNPPPTVDIEGIAFDATVSTIDL